MTRARFAAKTQVPIDRTRSELDAMLANNGATQRGTFQDDESLASNEDGVMDPAIRRRVVERRNALAEQIGDLENDGSP